MEQAWPDAHADFLSSLSAEEKDTLLRRAKTIKLAPRDLLFEAGDRSDDVFIIGTGCIKLFHLSRSGRQTILRFAFNGDLFGIAEILSKAKREISAEANVATEIYSISEPDFLDFLRTHPEASMRAIGILSARVRTVGLSLVDIATDDVETRLARLLLRFAAISEKAHCDDVENEGEVCINVRLTHQDIASLIGSSRQTVTTTLANLRKRGTLRTVNHHIHIVRPDHLRRMTEIAMQ
ncbi:MAG: Crp/Fnr family transcriptional regulator [Hyphomicrobiales bacterium]|nr:Crp/Fnr family transcriptional regulator [Hyphomicrobiales bacterium]